MTTGQEAFDESNNVLVGATDQVQFWELEVQQDFQNVLQNGANLQVGAFQTNTASSSGRAGCSTRYNWLAITPSPFPLASPKGSRVAIAEDPGGSPGGLGGRTW